MEPANLGGGKDRVHSASFFNIHHILYKNVHYVDAVSFECAVGCRLSHRSRYQSTWIDRVVTVEIDTHL